MTAVVLAARGDLPSGRRFRLAVADRAVAVWLEPVDVDGVLRGGDEDLVVVAARPRSPGDVEDLLEVVRAVTT